LGAEGFDILLDCGAEACGGFDFRQSVEVLAPPAMFVDLADFRYLSAEKDGEALSLLVSRGGGTGFVQVVRVVPPGEAVARPVPEVPETVTEAVAATFATRFESEGRVVLEDLAFATGSGEVAAGAEEVMAELAAYLAANPNRRVALVGHTDAQGSLSANVALSKERAEAVVERLVEAHGASPDQLQAEGMGWLAPRATNLTPEGRAANRRVEAVVLP
jgi:OOP family OmpA-OmpF porin